MPASRRIPRLAALALLVGASLLWGGAAAAADLRPRPARVVSVNLCTDQLAMLLADPGQLLSVSFLASDPRSSAMVAEAAKYPVNHGLAEEIYLMKPDLVIMGRYSHRATREMLERLSIPVAVFDVADSLADVRQRMLQMGEVLGQPRRAAAMVAEFDAGLSSYRATVRDRPRAVLYYANGYTAGGKTLAGEILTTAGFANVAAEQGFADGGVIPLEVLAMARPDTVITGQPYPGGSRSEEVMRHPVIAELQRTRPSASLTDHDWVCGTPHVLRAIDRMAALRREMAAPRP